MLPDVAARRGGAAIDEVGVTLLVLRGLPAEGDVCRNLDVAWPKATDVDDVDGGTAPRVLVLITGEEHIDGEEESQEELEESEDLGVAVADETSLRPLIGEAAVGEPEAPAMTFIEPPAPAFQPAPPPALLMPEIRGAELMDEGEEGITDEED